MRMVVDMGVCVSEGVKMKARVAGEGTGVGSGSGQVVLGQVVSGRDESEQGAPPQASSASNPCRSSGRVYIVSPPSGRVGHCARGRSQ